MQSFTIDPPKPVLDAWKRSSRKQFDIRKRNPIDELSSGDVLFQSIHASFGALSILRTSGPRHADSADDLSVHHKWDSSFNRDGVFNAKNAQSISAGRERTEGQWRELFAASGWEAVRFQENGVIEARPCP